MLSKRKILTGKRVKAKMVKSKIKAAILNPWRRKSNLLMNSMSSNWRPIVKTMSKG